MIKPVAIQYVWNTPRLKPSERFEASDPPLYRQKDQTGERGSSLINTFVEEKHFPFRRTANDIRNQPNQCNQAKIKSFNDKTMFDTKKFRAWSISEFHTIKALNRVCASPYLTHIN